MNLKRVLAVSAIGGTLALGLAACGSTSTPTPASPSTAAATASAAPTVAPTAPTAEPSADTSGVEQITVAPGGYFFFHAPKGFTAAYMGGGDASKLNIKQNYDTALIEMPPISVTTPPADAVKPASLTDVTTDAILFKTVDGASGAADFTMSYTDPKTGETVESALVVNIK